jgi:hypothetical protein
MCPVSWLGASRVERHIFFSRAAEAGELRNFDFATANIDNTIANI